MAPASGEGQGHKEQGRKNAQVFRLLIKGCTIKESAAAVYFRVFNTTFTRLEAASSQYKCLRFSPHPSVPDPGRVPNPEMIMSDGMVSAAVCVCACGALSQA